MRVDDVHLDRIHIPMSTDNYWLGFRLYMYVKKGKGKELLSRLDSVDLLDSKVFNAILVSLNICYIDSY